MENSGAVGNNNLVGYRYTRGIFTALWRSLFMMTSSNGIIFRVTGPLCGEFTGPGEFPTQRPVTRSFEVFFDLRLNKRLSKQPWGWWFETSSCSLWRQCNVSQSLCLRNIVHITAMIAHHQCILNLKSCRFIVGFINIENKFDFKFDDYLLLYDNFPSFNYSHRGNKNVASIIYSQLQNSCIVFAA